MKRKFQSPLPGRSKGFTLIELLVVIIIIAALAALVVPNVGSFGRSTDMAVSAKCQADITNNMEQFNALQGGYPQGLDSLLVGGTAIYSASQTGATATPAIATTSDNQTTGLPFSGADGVKLENLLTPLDLKALDGPPSAPTSQYTDSLVAARLSYVYDHDRAVINSNLSNTTFRALEANANGVNPAPTAVFVAALRPTIGAATPPATNPLLVKLVPGGVKAGQRVVAFGYGQRNTSIGVSVTTTPLYPGSDKSYYGRYIVYFMVYASGKPATLLGVSDSYGRTPDYTQQQFNESLPDGARQG